MTGSRRPIPYNPPETSASGRDFYVRFVFFINFVDEIKH